MNYCCYYEILYGVRSTTCSVDLKIIFLNKVGKRNEKMFVAW